MICATRVIWQAAGRPRPQDGEPYEGPCWWCGEPSHGRGRPRRSLPSTFTDAHMAACHDATHLCEPCGWSLSDGVGLTPELSEAQAEKKIAPAGTGRAKLLLDEDRDPRARGVRVSALRLSDGRVGVWTRHRQSEAAWKAAWERLADEPEDVDGCEYIGAFEWRDFLSRYCGKFRNYDHIATPEWWRPCKARAPSDRMMVREHLLSPPDGVWTCVLGDGQKHCAIYADTSDGRQPLQSVFLAGQGNVSYEPETLRALLHAVESLVAAGADDESIRSGSYQARGDVHLLLAQRKHEPAVRPHRGSPLLELAVYLRRSRADLEIAMPHHEEESDATGRLDPRAAQGEAEARAGDPPADGGDRPAGQQLSLWG